jgi:glycosyltransferase involved in cell wall biosynthesis
LPKLPDDVTAVFVRFNSHPATVAALEAEAIGLGLEDRVRFVPAIPHAEMPAYLRLADVVLSTPTSDGTPVTVLEAMAVGRPVIVTDLPSLREWLADIDPVALIPTGDVDSLVRVIRTMLDRDPVAAAEVIAAARARVVQRANEDDNLRQVELQYEAMASSGRRM